MFLVILYMLRLRRRAMMEAVRTSETSINFNMTTRRYIPEDSKLHTRHRENLKFHMFFRWTERALVSLIGLHHIIIIMIMNIVKIYVLRRVPLKLTINESATLSGSTVTTARRVLGLRIEEKASRYGG
jgi:hypothetical protein